MKKKFPLHKNLKNHLWIAFTLSLWVFMFLFFAEPFDINKFTETEKITLLPIYGVIQGVSYSIPLWYQYKIGLKGNKWSYINELIFMLLMITIGFTINYIFYKNCIAYNELGTYNYFHYLKWVYLPALVIILPFILIGRYLVGKFSENKSLSDKIYIKGKGKFDFITLKKSELVFVQSSDNYIEVNFIENNILRKKLIRETISGIAQSFPFLLKTHRSFLINPIHFKEFKTENKKLFISVGHHKSIPVSRGLQTAIKNELPLTTNK